MLTGVHRAMQEGLLLWVYLISLSKQGCLRQITLDIINQGEKNSPAVPTLKQKLPHSASLSPHPCLHV